MKQGQRKSHTDFNRLSGQPMNQSTVYPIEEDEAAEFRDLQESYLELAKTRNYSGKGKVHGYKFFNRHRSMVLRKKGQKCSVKETAIEWAQLDDA